MATDAASEAVRADFEDATPPPLALQWGIADQVRRTDDGGVYDVSSFFGLRSTSITVVVRSERAEDVGTGTVLELVVTADGAPWSTYSVTIDGRDGRIVLDVKVTSDRRFDLRRLPQWFVAERFRGCALAAQGYRVVERDVGLSG